MLLRRRRGRGPSVRRRGRSGGRRGGSGELSGERMVLGFDKNGPLRFEWYLEYVMCSNRLLLASKASLGLGALSELD